jgi:DNA anti-recombination protein RmuC
VDFAFFKAFHRLCQNVMTILQRLTRLLAFQERERAALLDELAATKDALAVALSNDASDAEQIAAAQADAAEARAKADASAAEVSTLSEQVTNLQGMVEADAAEAQGISDLIAPLEARIPEEPAA